MSSPRKMDKRWPLRDRLTMLVCLGATLVLPATARSAEPTPAPVVSKPNVIYIILDDMGFSDCGAFGSEIKTPNMDKLAAAGLRYNNFNVCPLSSPTRASLLTGRDHNAVGMGEVSGWDQGPDRPDMRGRISHSAATVAQLLKDGGYGTYAVGKWHVAPEWSITPAGPFDYWPLAKGFDRYYGFLAGETSQYSPVLTEDNHMVPAPKRPDYHLSEDLVDHAIQYLTDHVSVNPNKPFFANVAFGAPHTPHQVPRRYIEMYKGQYEKGWDVLRLDRFERQKKMGIIPANSVLPPRDPKVPAWSTMSPDARHLAARFMETYAGYITHADEQIGRLMEFLKATGEFEKTMIVLLSDNGATNVGGENGLDSFVGWFNQNRQTVQELLPRIDEIGGPDMDAVYPAGWAMVGNTPFPNYKGSVHAGAVRTPLIVHWPQGIQVHGAVRTQYTHITDITPTVLDLLQMRAPATFHGIEQMPLHGVSFAKTFADPQADPRNGMPQYYLMRGNRSIYQDGWKAIAGHRSGTSFDLDVWELYHVSDDYTESKDLAAQYPEKLAQLKKVWASEAAAHGAILKERNPRYVAPYSPAARTRADYLPKTGVFFESAIPRLFNKSYTISTTLGRKSAKEEGVLVALGDHLSGWTLYVKGNRLVYEYNLMGQRFKVTSKETLPLGKSTLTYEFQKTGDFRGLGKLFINGRPNGELVLPKTFRVQTTFDSFSVGRDAHSPVSEAYRDKGEFPFSGEMGNLVIEIKPETSKVVAHK